MNDRTIRPPKSPRLFVSYAHADETDGAWKTKILLTLRALRSGGIIDFFEDNMIDVGEEWDERLRRELDSFDLIIFIVSSAFLGSGYIESVEVKRALERHEAKDAYILPILAKPCDWTYRSWAKIQAFPRHGPDARPLSFWEKRGELDEGLLQISEQIRKWAAGWQPKQTVAIQNADIPTTQPYRGLFAFQHADEPDFFGREDLSDKLWTAVCANRLTLLTGASGSGKSSLVNAGIIPRLNRHGGWCVVRVRPGETPVDNLAQALTASMLPNADAITITDRAEELASRLKAQPDRVLAYARTHREQHGQALFLAFDQFEETYNLAKPKKDGQHGWLIELLVAIAESPADGPVTALLAMRTDFQPALQDDRPELVDAVQRSTIMMRRMTEAELASAIAGPAKRRGVVVEDGLLGRLVAEVAQNPDALPLLEATLDALWSTRGDGPLTLAAYAKLDGLAGALVSRAEAAVADPEIDDERSRRLFLQLVRIDPAGGIDNVTRRPRSRSDLGDGLWEIGQKLAAPDRRLLVIDGDTLDIVHEALFRRWERLASWIEKERDLLIFRERIDERMAEFAAHLQNPEFLLRQLEVDQAKEWLDRHEDAFTPKQRAFIFVSDAHWAQNAAVSAARALWGRFDLYRLDQFETFEPHDREALTELSQSNLEIRQCFLALALTVPENARKLARAADIVIRATLGVDPKIASDLAVNALSVKRDTEQKETMEARSVLIISCAPLLVNRVQDLVEQILEFMKTTPIRISAQTVGSVAQYVAEDAVHSIVEGVSQLPISAADGTVVTHISRALFAMAYGSDAETTTKVILLLKKVAASTKSASALEAVALSIWTLEIQISGDSESSTCEQILQNAVALIADNRNYNDLQALIRVIEAASDKVSEVSRFSIIKRTSKNGIESADFFKYVAEAQIILSLDKSAQYFECFSSILVRCEVLLRSEKNHPFLGTFASLLSKAANRYDLTKLIGTEEQFIDTCIAFPQQ